MYEFYMRDEQASREDVIFHGRYLYSRFVGQASSANFPLASYFDYKTSAT